MIIEVRAKNCYAFEDDITFSMKADMRNKKFGANVHKENNFNVLKTVGIYGPNNAGKTCLIKCIRAIRNVLFFFTYHYYIINYFLCNFFSQKI